MLRSHELRSRTKLHVAQGRPLYLMGLDLHLCADRGRTLGVALDVTAGKVLLDVRTQLF